MDIVLEMKFLNNYFVYEYFNCKDVYAPCVFLWCSEEGIRSPGIAVTDVYVSHFMVAGN